MFNEMFMKAAKRELTHRSVLEKLDIALQNRHWQNLGAVKVLSNGARVVDMDIIAADVIKRRWAFRGVCVGAAVLGHALAKI